MRHRVRGVHTACVLGLVILSGCASLLPLSPLAPFFPADSLDGTLIDALAHEQYTRVEHCQERKSCPQDHYTRALIALFQSRERALGSFQQVQALAQNSRIASLSASWIDVLQANGNGPSFLQVQGAGVKLTEHFVWETLERELAGANAQVRVLFRDRATRIGVVADAPVSATQDRIMIPRDADQGATARENEQRSTSKEKDPATVHALRKQLQERERLLAERDYRLAVMSKQLDDLKRIDQDSRQRQRSVRPSATITP
jgi:hypothetical protein